MTDGNGKGIGGIGRFWDLFEIQKARHHLLHLVFFRSTVSDYGGFDGERRVLGNLKACGRSGQHSDSTHLPELQCGLHVHGIENVLNRNTVGPVLSDEFLETAGNAGEPRGHGITGGDLDGSASDADEAIVGEQIDDTISGVFRAAVDAEDAHGCLQCNAGCATFPNRLNLNVREVHGMARIAGADPRRQSWLKGLLTRIVYGTAKRKLGHVVAPVQITAHHTKILWGYGQMEQSLAGSSLVEAGLKHLAEVRVATLVGCPF